MKPYKPDELPLTNLDWSALVDLLSTANRQLARYDGLLQSIINPEVLLSPLRTQEAVLSSKIEGTQATLKEVLEYEADKAQSSEKQGDIREIINYRKALFTAKSRLEDLPLSLRLIREMHAVLMQDVRGENKAPGEFRRIQNWIGAPGSTIETARFVPPAVQDMHNGLGNWEKYIHFEEKDPLVQLAIIHAQFEILHPFLDGNGRIGRILIPLFLFDKEIIREPVFYLSDYLENHRRDYYDALKDITDSGSWTNWIRFFLGAIISQARKNNDQTRQIVALYELMKEEIVNATHSQFAVNCLDFIFNRPIFNSGKFYEESGVPRASASRLLLAMEANNLIKCIEKGAGRRPSLYVFEPLLDIVNQ
ncbi:Fic/DOC family N-terminal domain-containing protein [Cyclobacterium sp.]|uniref:Fic family protein n=1 Tax=Cyclobacterium sp. TaxID=1966343 RepID=UPI0019A19B5B|nr:Fic/DOC family N-terminal domain-containing protein [Cyclobacterium sp.]MBD3627411.1 Fic family protein [Cyclobacterium sp.]